MKNFSVFSYLFKILKGALVGLGAVLPGISGGVLCVVFGIYKTIMEFWQILFASLKLIFPSFCLTV